MAAYAALLSLTHIIDDLNHHPRPPISLPKKQVASLTAKLNFLQEFLESYNPPLSFSTEADPLEMRIADAAYAAEDAIESHIVDQITYVGQNISSNALKRTLKKAISDMASIEKKVMKIQRRKSTPPRSSSSSFSSSIAQKKRSMMVGADGALLEMKDKLTSHSCGLQIIPIVGMGGTGKATLAINISEDRLIKEHFDIYAWATISQEYNIRQILIQILKQLIKEINQGLSEEEFGEMLYKHLFGRRFLIIIDDMWSIDAWDRVRRFFPGNENGSRIVVTTRLSNLASELSNSNSHEMSLLDEAHSWILLSKTVFGEKSCCPPELEDIGKKIGKSCKGLPLSIVAVGGFLAKSDKTREFWEYIEGDLNSIVNLGDGERCLKILYMSYEQLPIYLKPCFLYMGVFHEDEPIRVSRLISFWVAEGFLKEASGKSLEEVARACLDSLIDRNLVLIDKKGSTGNIKFCRMHDLLRDMCLREAEKERFYAGPTRQGIVKRLTPIERFCGVFKRLAFTGQGIANVAQRRIVISNTISKNKAVEAVLSTPRARSLIWYHEEAKVPPLGFSSRLLRVLHAPECEYVSGNQLVNARMLVLYSTPSRYNILWNLQTLYVGNMLRTLTAPTDIWHMPHIRHLRFINGLHLPDPPNSQHDDDIIWENLQTLKTINNFKCSKRVVKIIRNIKKLVIVLNDGNRYHLTNLNCLDKLESLSCTFLGHTRPDSLPSLIKFPHSLKKLTLYIHNSPCSGEILEKIGLLPCLEKLQFFATTFKESEWITTQGRFPSLKYLHLHTCRGLKVWTTESSHFPCLGHLRLDRIHEMEIPLDFADITALRLIELTFCKASVLSSAKRILEEQEELYGEETSLQVQVLHYQKDKEHDSLASPNFRFRYLTE